MQYPIIAVKLIILITVKAADNLLIRMMVNVDWFLIVLLILSMLLK